MIDWILIPVLATPVIWELFNDRKGDIHPNNDWIVRGLLMIAASVVASVIGSKSFLQCLTMSFGLFTLLFAYTYNILNKKKPWYNYLSKTAIPDRWPLWAQLHWAIRMGITLWVFSVCFSIYFWEEMMVWNYPYGH